MEIKARLKKLVKATGKPPLVVAREAGVPSWPLYRLMKGDTASYDVDAAAKLYLHLTGKTLLVTQ